MAKNWDQIYTKMDIADVCEDAADLLEGHWTRGEWYHYEVLDNYDDTGQVVGQETQIFYCIEGGMAAALGLDVTEINGSESAERMNLVGCPVYNAVLETLNLQNKAYGTFYDDLPTWNDQEERTEQHAIDLLRSTAKRMHGVEL